MKTALVLCGGGSLGSYEIGAWKKFREHGITFDIITGTSIGAINGAMIVSDRYEDALNLWEEIRTDKVMKYGIDLDSEFWGQVDFKRDSKFQKFISSYVKGHGVDNSPFMELCKKSIDPEKVVKSPIKFGCIATEYPSNKETRFYFTGANPKKVLPYLMASSACFPIFPKYRIKDKLYIDGGWKNNMPIDYAMDLGADKVYAVLLHSFPPQPQKPFYYHELPNVTLIEPSRNQGSIMSFKKTALENNMTLGYLDTGKVLGDYQGFSFAFDKTVDLYPKAHRFFMSLYKLGPKFYSSAKEFLTYDKKVPETEVELYLRNLERLADLYKIDPFEVYKGPDLVKKIKKAIVSYTPNKETDSLDEAREKAFLINKLNAEELSSPTSVRGVAKALDLIFLADIKAS